MRSSYLSPMYSIRHLRTASLLFSTEADGSCQKVKSDQNSQPDDSSTNHRTSVFQPFNWYKRSYYTYTTVLQDLTLSPASKKKHMYACCLLKVKGDSSQNWDLTVQVAVFINMNQASISTLSISHLRCFLKHVSVDLLCAKRLAHKM